jgi:small nuclear ribonucleoprotein (snRNP)-like protein
VYSRESICLGEHVRCNPTPLKGILGGADAKSNVILSDCTERVYSADAGVEEIPLGLYLVKGDQM